MDDSSGDLTRPAGPVLLLHRPARSATTVEVRTGVMHTVRSLGELPLPGPGEETVALVPFRQLAERGYHCHDDGEPLAAMTVRECRIIDRAALIARLPDEPITVTGGGFDVDDDSYAATVRRIIDHEIGLGEGANFVIRRTYRAEFEQDAWHAALTLFRRLLERETGAYWTFALHTGTRILVGATPERHASLVDGRLSMTPISGTYRAPADRRTVAGLLDFLADRKEIDELHMVVDEELKMMARVCGPGIRLHGPYLREMAQLVHTEYVLSGPTECDVREILRETMFVPTVTGSPLENACRVINRHEPTGRGYYSGVLAVVGGHRAGCTLDSAVLIRTADIGLDRTLTLGVGATLVRHSDPHAETAETHAKAAGLLNALRSDRHPAAASRRNTVEGRPLAGHPTVRGMLAGRTHTLARYWCGTPRRDTASARPLAGRRILVVDGEDAFTGMLGHQLTALGAGASIRPFDAPGPVGPADVVIIGPGPGDPCDPADRKAAALRATVDDLLDRGQPMLAICLGHQVLCTVLGIPVVRKARPNQGLQREIDLYGTPVRVGFYNTFTALAAADELASDRLPGRTLRVSRDRDTGEVHALSAPGLRSVQFHPESLLTEDGPAILTTLLSTLIDDGRGVAAHPPASTF
ncbi:anthranilate synthase family protein [Mangrovihabitans endophyticus]|uniref:anthranilate synthase n=1 Tax=Mangrovihabitans endophyticus TaxID=1751298 RepID=A0A8J3BT49_9ACTN|nr:anthranilate synthase family protein [Mangrovihabitans endophyticus]GGK75891.1 phenazine-specific anthranilate synthase component I [Mangrovihabitans endophyticus]